MIGSERGDLAQAGGPGRRDDLRAVQDRQGGLAGRRSCEDAQRLEELADDRHG